MKQLSPLAYVPRRATIQAASLGPVSLYLGAYLVACFLSSDPLLLLAATAGAAIAGFSCGAGRAVRFSLKLGFFLLITMVVVNALVTSRGATVLARLGEWPILGRVDVTAEAIAAGAVIGLRALGTMVVIGVWSACVDPDRVLRAAHGVARRSALTATLVSRLVPLAAADQSRLGEAARLRGPGAVPIGRAAMANRLLSGSLDRAVDVAATLELRGYALDTPRAAFNRIPSRYDLRFKVAGSLLMAVTLLSLLLGIGELTAYPEIQYAPDAASIGVAVLFALGGLVARKRGGWSHASS